MGFLFASLVEHGHRQSAGVNPQDRGIMCTGESMRSMQRRLHCRRYSPRTDHGVGSSYGTRSARTLVEPEPPAIVWEWPQRKV